MRRGPYRRRRPGRPTAIGAWTYAMATSALEDFIAAKLKPDVILPSQLARVEREEIVHEKERRFLRTLLLETFRDLTDPPRFWSPAERDWMRTTARAWFQYPDDSVISLRMVCDALGLSVSRMQQTAREIVAAYEEDRRLRELTAAQVSQPLPEGVRG